MRYITLDIGGVAQPLSVPDSVIAYRIVSEVLVAKAPKPQEVKLEFLNLLEGQGSAYEVWKSNPGFTPLGYGDYPEEPFLRGKPGNPLLGLTMTRTRSNESWTPLEAEQSALDKLAEALRFAPESKPTSGSKSFNDE